jgi:addiction module HigA family antidote
MLNSTYRTKERSSNRLGIGHMSKTLAPVHPGAVLREDFLDPMNLSAYAIARACGVPRTRIERLAREETPVTADTALRLAKYFGTTAAFWMGMQAQYDLERTEDEVSAEIKRIQPVKAA